VTDSCGSRRVDSASPLGLQMLEELRILLLECQLVVVALADEVDLNFEDCHAGLTAVRELAEHAWGAASLLSQNAALESSWSNWPSRPKAIYVRHAAAVKAGATRRIPLPSLVGVLEAKLEPLWDPDLSQNYSGARPACTGFVAGTRKLCTNSTFYLGAGSFAQHCYSHGTPDERQRYRDHQELQKQIAEESWWAGQELLQRIGRIIIDEWVQKRKHLPPWFGELLER